MSNLKLNAIKLEFDNLTKPELIKRLTEVVDSLPEKDITGHFMFDFDFDGKVTLICHIENNEKHEILFKSGD